MFSEHASLSLFECLIVAGAPATGLLQDTFKCESSLQLTLQLLRDMWQRADTLYVPSSDLDCLHAMECSSAACHRAKIPDPIVVDDRKLSRYYIYLLFRYCMSSAGPMAHRWSRVSHWEAKKHPAPLVDIPKSWLETKVCTTYPSAPPVHYGNFPESQDKKCPFQPQRLPQALERERHGSLLPQQPPVERQRCPQQQQRAPQRSTDNYNNNNYAVQRVTTAKGPDNASSAFRGGYDSAVDSEEDY